MNQKLTLLLIIVLIGTVYGQGQLNKGSQSIYSMKLLNQIKDKLFEKIVPGEMIQIQDTEFQFEDIKCLVRNAVLYVPRTSIHLYGQNGELSILALNQKFQFEAKFSQGDFLSEVVEGEFIFSQHMTPQYTQIDNYTYISGIDINKQKFKKLDYGNLELFSQIEQQFQKSMDEYLGNQLRVQLKNIAQVINSMLEYQTKDFQYGNSTCSIDQSFVVRDVQEEYVIIDHGNYGWNNQQVKQTPPFDNLASFPQVNSEMYNINRYIQYFNEYYFNSISNTLFEAGIFEKVEEQQSIKNLNIFLNLDRQLASIKQKLLQNNDLKLKYKALERPVFKIQDNQISSYWSLSVILFKDKDNQQRVIDDFRINLKVNYLPELVQENQAFKLKVQEVLIQDFSAENINQDVANKIATVLLSNLPTWQFKEENKINSQYFLLENATISFEGENMKIEGVTKML